MADGQNGVEKVVEILQAEISNTMALMGISKISEINSSHAKLRNN
jgi:L-lactate dehydrogenase (cytochrome)